MAINNIYDQLRRDEGEVLHVYLDSKGVRTAGVGHNLESHGINWSVDYPVAKEMSDSWLTSDVDAVNLEIYVRLPWASTALNDARFGVLQNLAFNMGIKGLMGFKKTLGFIENGLYSAAATEMLNSSWATQVGARADRLAEQMSSGVWV